MGFVLKKLESLLTRRITGSKKYTVKCLVCFAEKKGASRREVVEFLNEHARSHAINFGAKGIINDLYHPFSDLRYTKNSHYMISREM